MRRRRPGRCLDLLLELKLRAVELSAINLHAPKL